MPSRSNTTELDTLWMQLALKLAEKGRGHVEPNPIVGCILTTPGSTTPAPGSVTSTPKSSPLATGTATTDPSANDANLDPSTASDLADLFARDPFALLHHRTCLGSGYHAVYGQGHAEVNAVQDADRRGNTDRIAGCTAYVTLEPCSHTGKTPPCADLLIDRKVSRVVIATQDPFEQVAGRGIEKLKDAGIDVTVGIMQEAAQQQNAPFFKRVQHGLPYTILKWAQTLDGKTACSNGHSQWISNALSRHRVHTLRARVDAIICGVGTAIADDPQMTAREVHVLRTARRVLIDPNLRAPLDLQLLTDDGPPVTVATTKQAAENHPTYVQQITDRGGEIYTFDTDPSSNLYQSPQAKAHKQSDGHHSKQHNLTGLLKHLASKHQVSNVLVEGGASTHAAFLEQQLADEVRVYIAPKLAGDAAARPALDGQALLSMHEAQALDLIQTQQLEGDLELIYRV